MFRTAEIILKLGSMAGASVKSEGEKHCCVKHFRFPHSTTTKRKRSRQIGRDGHEGFYIKQGLSGLARSNETEG
jgi:hypothetical protein